MTTDKSSKRTVEDYGSKSRDELIDMVKQRDSQVAHLIHQIDVFRRMQFGPRTEKQSGPIDPKGLLPFPSLKALLDEVEANAKARAAAQLALKQQTAKTRTPRGPRSQFPEHLPRLRRAKELSKEELTCSCGCLRKKIREEKSQRLERIAVTYVEEIVTIYYACAKCETVLASKPDAPSVIEGGLLGPNFLAELIHDHFGLHLPYSRIEKKLGYEGLELSRSVLCSSVLRCGELLRPIYDALVKHVLSNFLVRVDETPVVIRNGNAKGRKRGFFWIYGSQDGCTFFDLRPDRGRASPEQHLAGFRGFIQDDAFAGYDFLFKGEGEGVRTEIGCWAHMRRKFFEASASDPEFWQEISAMLCVVFEIERQSKGLKPEARYTPRQLIIFCDGTNNTLTGGTSDTNVLRLFEALHRSNDRQRVLYYDPGVGSRDLQLQAGIWQGLRRWLDRLAGLASGQGIFENITQAYVFLMREYREGDPRYWRVGPFALRKVLSPTCSSGGRPVDSSRGNSRGKRRSALPSLWVCRSQETGRAVVGRFELLKGSELARTPHLQRGFYLSHLRKLTTDDTQIAKGLVAAQRCCQYSSLQ